MALSDLAQDSKTAEDNSAGIDGGIFHLLRRAQKDQRSSTLTFDELTELQNMQISIESETEKSIVSADLQNIAEDIENEEKGDIENEEKGDIENEEKKDKVVEAAMPKSVLDTLMRIQAVSSYKRKIANNDKNKNDNATGTLNNLQASRNRDSFYSPLSNKPHFDCKDCSHVRRPRLGSLISTSRFLKYAHRFANSQINRTLCYPTLPQPQTDEDTESTSEMVRTRPSHRFVIAADTQFGILMDGFAMENPNWNTEIDISRDAVKKLNAMKGPERPLFVCVCGDLLDTESSFSFAMASWKKVMKDWERDLVFDQQVKDWKQVWSQLDKDIALVCLCGNHDVGNRPTPESIQKWTSAFGDDYLAFWVNGTYNIGMNNCLFADPTGAMDLFDEQLNWLEERLKYAKAKGASHIFVYSHYPWFLIDEDEEASDVTGTSVPPPGWGPKGAKFSDSYFHIPNEYRQLALTLFREYNVKACFSGHFHQNVNATTSWGMDMIITAALSMPLESSHQHLMSDEPQKIGMRVVDVDENHFTHKFIPLDDFKD